MAGSLRGGRAPLSATRPSLAIGEEIDSGLFFCYHAGGSPVARGSTSSRKIAVRVSPPPKRRSLSAKEGFFVDTTGPYEPTRSTDSIATRIDLACDELEAAWQREEQPRIEEYLVGFSESDLPRVLRELLLVELAYRRSREEPTAEEYRERFPQHVEVIETVFRDSMATNLPPADYATARSLLFGVLRL